MVGNEFHCFSNMWSLFRIGGNNCVGVALVRCAGPAVDGSTVDLWTCETLVWSGITPMLCCVGFMELDGNLVYQTVVTVICVLGNVGFLAVYPI